MEESVELNLNYAGDDYTVFVPISTANILLNGNF